MKKPANQKDFAGFYYLILSKSIDLSGERGIRTPGGVTLNGFQDRRIRPLCHLSGANVRFGIYSKNKKGYFFENNFRRNSIFVSDALCN